MTMNEITKRIEVLENRRFMLAMKDRWSRADYELDDELLIELIALRKQKEEMA